MNNTNGIRQTFSQREALTILARSVDPSKPTAMLEAVKLLAAVCLIPPPDGKGKDGHEKALEAITMSGEFKGRERFEPIVQGLLIKENEKTLRVSWSDQFKISNQLMVYMGINIFCSFSRWHVCSSSMPSLLSLKILSIVYILEMNSCEWALWMYLRYDCTKVNLI